MKAYRSKIAAAMHELISDFHEIGLADKRTMRRFDESCLIPVEELTPEQSGQKVEVEDGK